MINWHNWTKYAVEMGIIEGAKKKGLKEGRRVWGGVLMVKQGYIG